MNDLVDAPSLIAGLAVGLLFGIGTTAVFAQQSNQNPEMVMENGLAPTRTAPSGNVRVKALAEGKNAYFGMMSVAPGATVPEHTDDAEEYLYVLEGTGQITINDNTYDVKPGTAAYIPTGAKTKFKANKNKFTAIQVFAGPGPADKYTQWNVGGAPIQPTKSKGTQRRGRGSNSSSQQ
jgi:quercetin dioxygenase-like cupin family protein